MGSRGKGCSSPPSLGLWKKATGRGLPGPTQDATTSDAEVSRPWVCLDWLSSAQVGGRQDPQGLTESAGGLLPVEEVTGMSGLARPIMDAQAQTSETHRQASKEIQPRLGPNQTETNLRVTQL